MFARSRRPQGPELRYSRVLLRLYDLAAASALRRRRPIQIDDIVEAMLSDRESLAFRTLSRLKANPDSLRAEVQAALSPVGDAAPARWREKPGQPSKEAKRAVVIAYAQARNFGHSEVSTDHLLLGCLLEGSCEAARVVESLGVDPYQVGDIVRHRGDRREGPAPQAPPDIIATMGGGETGLANPPAPEKAAHVKTPTPGAGTPGGRRAPNDDDVLDASAYLMDPEPEPDENDPDATKTPGM